MQNTAFLARRVCSFGKRPCVHSMQSQPSCYLLPGVCAGSPSVADCIFNMAPIPHALLQRDLPMHPPKSWSPFIHILNLDGSCDCLDQ